MDLSSSEVHTVGSLLKLYLRELPEPLFTFHLGPQFDEAVGESLQACIPTTHTLSWYTEHTLCLLRWSTFEPAFM